MSAFRMVSIACSIDCCLPAHSSTACAPTSLVMSARSFHALLAPLGNDVGRAELASELLPLLSPSGPVA
jgi:hypothetical protein